MKILYIVHDMYVGGVSTVVNSLMQGMSLSNHEIYIVVLKNKEVDILCSNVNIINIHNKIDYVRGLFELRRIIKKIKPDVIHSHTVLCHILTLFLKYSLNKKLKVICTEHSSLMEKQSNSLIFRVFSLLSRAANKITFVSNFSLKSYMDYGVLTNPKNAIVIYNGINAKDVNLNNSYKVKNELNIKEGERVLCYIGRISPEKNLEMMFHALSLLRERNLRLIVVGEGQDKYEKTLIDLVVKLNLKNVDFIGHRNDIVEIINNIDCLLLSSFVEGLPTVVIEAYSQKKIVISTVCGGVHEIVENENFLAENDNVNDFVDKIIYYLGLDDQEEKIISEYNYAIYCEKFHINLMVRNFHKLYQGVIND